MKKVLRIITRMNIGGPAIHVANLARHMDNYETLLVHGATSEDEGGYMSWDREGIKHIKLHKLGREILWQDFEVIDQLKKVIADFKPDIIHTHTAKAGFVGRTAGKNSGAKLVHTFHGNVFKGYFGHAKTFVFKQLEKRVASFTDKIIVLNNQQKREIQNVLDVPDSKMEVIPLGFDLKRLATGDKNKTGKVKLIGIIGRLTDIKNHKMLIDAVRKIPMRQRQYFRFYVVGDGELKSKLIEYARYRHVWENFLFTGWQLDMAKMYQKLDAVVLTSKNEGTPVTLIEALYMGIPIIATNVGGVKETIQNFGTLVQPYDTIGLAKALMNLQENYYFFKMEAEEGRKYAAETFTIEGVVNNLNGVYDKLLLTG